MKIRGWPFSLYRNSRHNTEARGMDKELHMDNNSITNNSLLRCRQTSILPRKIKGFIIAVLTEETLTHDYLSYLLQEFIKWKTPKTAAVPFSTTKFERYVTSED